MYISKKIIAVIVVIILGILIWYYYNQFRLKHEYVKRLDEMEDAHIDQFYRSSMKGTISYLKKYEETPVKYVVSIKDSTGAEQTFGKVAITNFSNVKEGDLIEKKPETFDLRTMGSEGESVCIVQYE